MKRYIFIKLDTSNCSEIHQYEYFEKMTKYCVGIDSELIDKTVYISYEETEENLRVVNDLRRYFNDNYTVYNCDLHIFKKDNESIIKHPINPSVPITAFPYISMFLPVLLSNAQFQSWFYCHFLNLICINDRDFYTYTDDRKFMNDVIIKNDIRYDKYISIKKDLFIEAIKDDCYIYTWIDSCYSGDWDGTNSRHEAHPILIYGVDLKSNIYYCYRFSPMKGVFLCEYDIDMVHKSIDSARVEIGDHTDDSHLVIFKLKNIYEKDLFNKNRFLRELGNYIFSFGEKVEQYTRAEIQTLKEHEHLFGLDVTKNVIDLFLGNKHNHHFDYRMIHLITEHKRVLYNSFLYAINKYNIKDSKLDEKLCEFLQVVSDYEKIKNYYMMQALIESNKKGFYKPPKREKAVNRIVSEYKRLVTKEKDVLLSIYDLLTVELNRNCERTLVYKIEHRENKSYDGV